VGNRRIAEWSLLTLLLVVLLSVFGHQVRSVQMLAERAAVQSTVGALRTALVLSHVTAQLNRDTAVAEPTGPKEATAPTAAPVSNPFLLLQTRPGNFAGSFAMEHTDTMPLGAWAFDADCGCVGYRLLYPDGLELPEGAVAVWFRVDSSSAVLQMVPVAQYVWQGQVLN
jgi:hypothetical protein